MRNKLLNAALATAAVLSGPVMAGDRGHQMQFRWIAHQLCQYGGAGTFTPAGDVTNYFSLGTAYGSGTFTFNTSTGTVESAAGWLFETHNNFLPLPPNGNPQGVYPARTSEGTCTYSYLSDHEGTWTLEAPPTGCVSHDTSGPNVDKGDFTFTNGPKIKGQFAPDMQSFVAWSTELQVENGLTPNKEAFERICMTEFSGVRVARK